MPVLWEYPPPPDDYTYYWLDPKSKQDSQSYKFQEFAKNSSIWILKNKLHVTHLLKVLDKMSKYVMDIRRILLKIPSGHDSVDRRTNGQVDRWTDGQGETNIIPLPWESGGIIIFKLFSH